MLDLIAVEEVFWMFADIRIESHTEDAINHKLIVAYMLMYLHKRIMMDIKESVLQRMNVLSSCCHRSF